MSRKGRKIQLDLSAATPGPSSSNLPSGPSIKDPNLEYDSRGRVVRDGPPERGAPSSFGEPGAADTADTWRRSPGGGFGNDRGGGFNNDDSYPDRGDSRRSGAADEDSEWRKGPSDDQDQPPRRSAADDDDAWRRGPAAASEEREVRRSAADDDDAWRRTAGETKPLEPMEPRPVRPADEDSAWRASAGVAPPPAREPRPLRPADEDDAWRRTAGETKPLEPMEPRPVRPADEDSAWRASAGVAPPPAREPRPIRPADEDSAWRKSASTTQQPPERRKLKLAPRSSDALPVDNAPTNSSGGIFGKAKPVSIKQKPVAAPDQQRKPLPKRKSLPKRQPRALIADRGDLVATPYGQGTVIRFRPDGFYVLKMGSLANGSHTIGYICKNDVKKVSGGGSSSSARRVFGDKPRDLEREAAFSDVERPPLKVSSRFQGVFDGGSSSASERPHRRRERATEEDRERFFGKSSSSTTSAFGSSGVSRRSDMPSVFGSSGRKPENAIPDRPPSGGRREFPSAFGGGPVVMDHPDAPERPSSATGSRREFPSAFGQPIGGAPGEERRPGRPEFPDAFVGGAARGPPRQSREDREAAFSAFGAGRRGGDDEERGPPRRSREEAFAAFGGGERSERGDDRGRDDRGRPSMFGRDHSLPTGSFAAEEAAFDMPLVKKTNVIVVEEPAERALVSDEFEHVVSTILKKYVVEESKTEALETIESAKVDDLEEEFNSKLAEGFVHQCVRADVSKELKVLASLASELVSRERLSSETFSKALETKAPKYLEDAESVDNLRGFVERLEAAGVVLELSEELKSELTSDATNAEPEDDNTYSAETLIAEEILSSGMDGVELAEAVEDPSVSLATALIKSLALSSSDPSKWAARYGPLLRVCLGDEVEHDDEVSPERATNMSSLLDALCSTHSTAGFPRHADGKSSLLEKTMMKLFGEDVVLEEGFAAWKAKSVLPELSECLVEAQKFIAWLDEDEEDDE